MITPEREKEIRFHSEQFHHNSTAIDDVDSERAIRELLSEIDRLRASNNNLIARNEELYSVQKRVGDSFKLKTDALEKERDDLTKRLETINSENEKLKQDMYLVVSDAGKDLIQLQAENEHFRRDYDRHDLILERDQLKAENDSLKKQIDALIKKDVVLIQQLKHEWIGNHKENKALKAENEKLKDKHYEFNRALETGTVLLENQRLRERVNTLFDKIKHGDEKHQIWLKDAIQKHFSEDQKHDA